MQVILIPILVLLGFCRPQEERPQPPPWIDEQKISQRIIGFDIVFDTRDKRVWTTHAGITWPPKTDTRPNGTFVLEYTTASGKTIREPHTLLGATHPLNVHTGEINPVLTFHARVLSDEDGVGYRVINSKDGSVMVEQRFPQPKDPLKITCRYEPLKEPTRPTGPYPPAGFVIETSRPINNLECAWTLDPQDSTWNRVMSCIQGIRPDDLDPILKAYPGRDVYIEVRIAENLTFYRRRFKLNGNRQVLEQKDVPPKTFIRAASQKGYPDLQERK